MTTRDTITNPRPTFQSPYEQYADRIGQPFTIIDSFVENAGTEDELVLYNIRFEDGTVINAWPEEIDADEIWQPRHGPARLRTVR